MKRVLKIILWLIGIVLVSLVFIGALPLARFLPSSNFKMTLPITPDYDSSVNLIPMGETINHPKPESPLGHPGLDFGWHGITEPIPLIAVADGKIKAVYYTDKKKNERTVELAVDRYVIRYTEATEIPETIKPGTLVKKGEIVAYTGINVAAGRLDHAGTHWELSYNTPFDFLPWIDRLCPVNYFDSQARQRLDQIWARIPLDANQGMKRQFPDICSGDYATRHK